MRDHICMCTIRQEIVFGDAHDLVGQCDDIKLDQFEYDQTSVRRRAHDTSAHCHVPVMIVMHRYCTV